jgi:hypothetical protein
LLKVFLGVGEFLLIHVGDAESVEAKCVAGVGMGLRGGGVDCRSGFLRRGTGHGCSGTQRRHHGGPDGESTNKYERDCSSPIELLHEKVSLSEQAATHIAAPQMQSIVRADFGGVNRFRSSRAVPAASS